MSHAKAETLAAYWLAELPEAEQLALEDHLFACEQCTAASARMAALPRALAFAVPPVITTAEGQRLQALDARIQRTCIAPGGRGVADFSKGAEAQLMVLEAELRGAERVEIVLCTRDGTVLMPPEPAPFDAEAGTIIVACRSFYLANGSIPLEITLQVEAITAGERRTVGHFEIDHVLAV
jgi:anti-sigma factor RsiW